MWEVWGDRREEGLNSIFWGGTFWYVHELPAGLVLHCPLLFCLSVLFPPSLRDVVYPSVDKQLFPQGCWKDGSIEANLLTPCSMAPKWTRMPFNQVCPHEEIISALWFENRSYATVHIINNGLLNFSPCLYTKQCHSDLVSNCMVYTVKLPSVPSVFLLAQVPWIKLWHSRWNISIIYLKM